MKKKFLFFIVIVLMSSGAYTMQEQQAPGIGHPTNNEELAKLFHENLPTEKINPWHSVNNKIRNTVLQIFSKVSALHWLQPYRTPDQCTNLGSGFLISKNGHIITNAHVVDQGKSILCRFSSLGQRKFRVNNIGICPKRDLALLRINDEDLEYIRKELGSIPYLTLGNSDDITKSDEIVTVGHPLGQSSLKITKGIVSGFETLNQRYIVTDAPVNPGSSGGPVLNTKGEVIGISTSMIFDAQNIGYLIPSNTLQLILKDLHNTPLLRKPQLGILSHKVTDALTAYLGNPQPGGCYIVEVVKDSPLDKAGVQPGDMIYEINNNKLDIYGEMNVDWSESKVSFTDYTDRLAIGEKVHLVIYRHGKRIEKTIPFDLSKLTPIRIFYPLYEEVDYEVFAGMVVMPFRLNHLKFFGKQMPGLKSYRRTNKQTEPILLISHILLNSELEQSESINFGSILTKVNEISVHTLDDFRNAIKKSIETNYVVIEAIDQTSLDPKKMIAVLRFDKVLEEAPKLAELNHYSISETVRSLMISNGVEKEILIL